MTTATEPTLGVAIDRYKAIATTLSVMQDTARNSVIPGYNFLLTAILVAQLDAAEMLASEIAEDLSTSLNVEGEA